jgi:D-sedoheptulose 7-phosphate isomerase
LALVARRSLLESAAAKRTLAAQQTSRIVAAGSLLARTFRRGGKLLLCGNGGSAADAQHLAAEFVGRFRMERRALPAICLTTNTSTLTAVSNDYRFEACFARQVEAFGVAGDVLLAISTSGRSPNVLNALRSARSRRLRTIGLTGAAAADMVTLSDVPIVVPSRDTQRIQECHIAIAHVLCELVEILLYRGAANRKS